MKQPVASCCMLACTRLCAMHCAPLVTRAAAVRIEVRKVCTMMTQVRKVCTLMIDTRWAYNECLPFGTFSSVALCSGRCVCRASVPLSGYNTRFCIGVVGADTLLESFVPVKLSVCSTPSDNKSTVVIVSVILARVLRLSCVGHE